MHWEKINLWVLKPSERLVVKLFGRAGSALLQVGIAHESKCPLWELRFPERFNHPTASSPRIWAPTRCIYARSQAPAWECIPTKLRLVSLQHTTHQQILVGRAGSALLQVGIAHESKCLLWELRFSERFSQPQPHRPESALLQSASCLWDKYPNENRHRLNPATSSSHHSVPTKHLPHHSLHGGLLG